MRQAHARLAVPLGAFVGVMALVWLAPTGAVAQGSPPVVRNLLSNGNFSKGMADWEVTGQTAAAQTRTGNGMLVISSDRISPNYQVRQSLVLSAKHLYRLSFTYRGRNIKGDPTLGIGAGLDIVRKSGTARQMTIRLAFPANEPIMRHVAWFCPLEDLDAWLTIRWAWVQGELSIGDLRMDEVDMQAKTGGTLWPWQFYPPRVEPFADRVNVAVPWACGETNLPQTPDRLMADDEGGSSTGAFAAFVPDLDALTETAAPDEGTPTSVRRTALRGERVQFCVAIRSDRNLSGVRAQLAPGQDWRLAPPEPDTVRLVRWMARRGNEQRLGTYSVVPELLDSQPASGGVPVGANRNQAFWVRVEVPSDAAPGVHRATVNIEADRGTVQVPVEITVGRAALVEPDTLTTAQLTDSSRWLRPWDTDEAAGRQMIVTELTDLWDHGVRCISVGGFGVQFGTLTVTGGEVTGVRIHPALLYAAQAWDRIIEAQLGGGKWRPQPGVILEWANPVGDILVATRGFTAADAANYERQLGEVNGKGDALRRQAVAAINSIKRDMAGNGPWALYATDEPSGAKHQVGRWFYRLARDAGVTTFTTGPGTVVREVLEGKLDDSILSIAAYSNAREEPDRVGALRAASRKAGVGFWHYAHAGMYSLQGGNAIRNRYCAGLLMELLQADGQLIWPFQRPFGDAFDDFDAGGPQWWNTGRDWCLPYPRNSQYVSSYKACWKTEPPAGVGNVSSLQWEGMREAWTDRAYLATARQRLNGAALRRVESALSALPYSHQVVYGPGGMSNPALEQFRKVIWQELEGSR